MSDPIGPATGNGRNRRSDQGRKHQRRAGRPQRLAPQFLQQQRVDEKARGECHRIEGEPEIGAGERAVPEKVGLDEGFGVTAGTTNQCRDQRYAGNEKYGDERIAETIRL